MDLPGRIHLRQLSLYRKDRSSLIEVTLRHGWRYTVTTFERSHATMCTSCPQQSHEVALVYLLRTTIANQVEIHRTNVTHWSCYCACLELSILNKGMLCFKVSLFSGVNASRPRNTSEPPLISILGVISRFKSDALDAISFCSCSFGNRRSCPLLV